MTSRTLPPPCVLTIAGSDSGGGAGVQADARTIHALGGFACMAITAITAQNTRGVQRWRAESPALIAAQMEAVLGEEIRIEFPLQRRRTPRVSSPGALPVRAMKTGLIPGAAAVRAIAWVAQDHGEIPLVVDPVIGSTTGTLFLDLAGVRMLKQQLLPCATVVTPNWPEAEALSGIRLRSFNDAERAASAIVDEIGCAVLVKGGHGPGNVCRDCLVTRDGRVRWYESARVATPNTHGTGCVLASAIAVGLAQQLPLERAVVQARRFLQASLRRQKRVRWGGAGPAFAG